MKNQQHVAITIDAPLAGTIRKTSFQSTPPFSCYDSINMWNVDAKDGRSVSAPRPALEALPIPTGKSKCNMLCRVNGVETSKPVQGFVSAFDSDVYYWNSSDNWTAATGAQASAIETGRAVHSTPFLQNAIIFSGSASPLVFEYGAATVTELTESAGTAPQNAKFGHVFQGALFVAGEAGNEHILYQSRVDDFTDWDYGVASTDVGGAWFSGVEDSGLLNGPVTAIFGASNDRVFLSTLEGIYSMDALPRQGGVFNRVSKQYVMGQGAWCALPDGTIYAMTPAGLLVIAPNSGAVPVVISDNRIPEELIGLRYDYDDPVISLEYSTRWKRVIITVRDLEQQSWSFDPTLGAFERMEFDGGYPYQLLEYPPFITDQTCGVVFAGGGARPVARFDKFGTETFSTRQIVGPIKISNSSMEKSMIDKARFVFHRDSPGSTAEGVVRIACGATGPDVINRLLSNETERTFTAPLSNLDADNGLCYPKIAGHAMAFDIEQTVGGVSYEELTLMVRDAGSEKGMRSTPLPVVGNAVTFTAPSNDFDEDVWQGYSQATPDDPCTTLTDTTMIIDLSGMPASWWAIVKPDGRDIRATDTTNTPLPLDLITFSYGSQTGLATVKITQTIPARPVRLWAGAEVGAPTVSSTYGGQNAYDANTIGFWPSGGGADRTGNANDFTMTGATDGDSTGPLGSSPATDYGGNTNWYGVANNANVPAASPITLMLLGRRADATTTSRGAFGVHKAGASPTTNAFLSPNRKTTGSNGAASQITVTVSGTGTESAESDEGTTPYAWHHYAGVAASAASRSAYIDGGGKQSDTDTLTLADLDEIVIGKGSRSALSSNSFQGILALASLHDTARSDCWISYQADMLDQATFWNGWGEFVEVNDPPTTPDPDVGACPVFPSEPAETGTWSGYAEMTPIATIAANEVDWTHLIDLANMPNDWWSAVASDGIDIRATDDQNIFIPFDLIEFDSSAMTGLIAVKLSQSTTPQAIRLWVGNGSAVAVGNCASYGPYQAYDQYWLGFWPKGGGNDRTQWLQHMEARPTSAPPTVGGSTGPIGNTATDHDGVSDYSVSTNLANAATPVTFVSAADFNSTNGTPPDSPNRRTMIGQSGIALQWFYDEARACLRQVLRPGGAFTTSSAPTPGTWRMYFGHAQDPGYRRTYINGTAATFDANTLASSAYFSPTADAPAIGASISNDDPTQTLVELNTEANIVLADPFYGKLSLVSVHSTYRSQEWAQYHAAMLDQATFWGSSWAWTASSSSLPQS